MSRALPSWQPTSVQEQLLDACLLSGKDALDAWHQWQAKVDLQRLDAGSYRLLPLLWRNLSRLGVDDPSMAVFKGVYRRTWYHNQMILAQAEELVATLCAAGIPTLALKGLPLTTTTYCDTGARPMGDVDLAVPSWFARPGVERLFANGWKPKITPLRGDMAAKQLDRAGWTLRPRPPEQFGAAYFGVRHAHSFEGPRGIEVDLHWHVFQERCDAEADDDLWKAALPIRLGHTVTLALCPADQLVHVCVHAARWDPVPSIRWVADAAMVIRKRKESLDWDRVVASARHRALTVPLQATLGYLRTRFHVPMPPEVENELRRTRVSGHARWAYRVRISRPGFAAGVMEICYLAGRYRTMKRDEAIRRKLPGFATFLRDILGAEHLWQLVLYSAFEAVRRTRQKARPVTPP